MAMLVRQCPRCAFTMPPGARYCPACGAPAFASPAPFVASWAPYGRPNTHTEGFIVIAFLVSFLWFRINGIPLLPVGLFGGLVIAWWSQDIDRVFGKPSQFYLSLVLSLLGAFIGFFL